MDQHLKLQYNDFVLRDGDFYDQGKFKKLYSPSPGNRTATSKAFILINEL
jgi:hypothetical protein